MSSNSIRLDLEPRTVVGKKVASLRRQGKIPAVIYEGGKESQLVAGPAVTLTRVWYIAGRHQPVELYVGKENHLAMIKTADLDPVTHQLRHLEFHAINRNQKVEAEIPVHLGEDVPAERMSLTVLKVLENVRVEALPSDLPEAFELDGTKLNAIGDRLTVADITVPKGVVILDEPDTMIVVVEEPKVYEEPVVEAEGEEGVEGETSEAADGEGGEETKETA